MKWKFSISRDTFKDTYVSQAYRSVNLPYWRTLDIVVPSIEMEVDDVNEAIEEYKKGNQTRVNQILWKYISHIFY